MWCIPSEQLWQCRQRVEKEGKKVLEVTGGHILFAEFLALHWITMRGASSQFMAAECRETNDRTLEESVGGEILYKRPKHRWRVWKSKVWDSALHCGWLLAAGTLMNKNWCVAVPEEELSDGDVTMAHWEQTNKRTTCSSHTKLRVSLSSSSHWKIAFPSFQGPFFLPIFTSCHLFSVRTTHFSLVVLRNGHLKKETRCSLTDVQTKWEKWGIADSKSRRESGTQSWTRRGCAQIAKTRLPLT